MTKLSWNANYIISEDISTCITYFRLNAFCSYENILLKTSSKVFFYYFRIGMRGAFIIDLNDETKVRDTAQGLYKLKRPLQVSISVGTWPYHQNIRRPKYTYILNMCIELEIDHLQSEMPFSQRLRFSWSR